MAETMTLRAYLDDVKRLLDRGAATEVISHCRYILQHYPRNVETYRLLAQALLQKAQDQGSGTLFDEAIEVFQRVLGVLPGDHVAHIGLSEIREHEGRLDQAIWHLERAYEQLPGNPMLQEGLRTLYTKRDGDSHTPAKVHLTRGALARQYVNGQLYDQALIELRHALEQNPARLDLQVMLAETLFESHHVVEAGEVALQILKKLPDCLPANRIMARLWLDNERPSDAQVFLDRVEALDPYAAAQVLQPGANLPDPNQIRRLDYGTEAQASLAQGTPDWVQDLGAVDIGTVFQSPPSAAPDFGAADARQSGQPFPGSETADEGLSFDWFTGQSEPADDAVGDWFSMMDQDEPAATPPAAPGPADAGWLSDIPAEPGAGLPDWFAELGEPGGGSTESAAQPPIEADWLFGSDEFEIPEDLPGEIPAPESPVIEPADSEWMAGFDSLEAGELDLPATEPGEVPDWLSGAGPVQEELATGADQLGWLESDLPPDAPPPAPEAVPASEPAAEADWLENFGSVDASAFDVFEAQEDSEPAWPAEEAGPAPEPAELAADADWLADVGSADSAAFAVEEEQGVSELAWPAEEGAPAPEAGEEATEVDWLAEEAEVPPALDEILGEPEIYSPAEAELAEERPSSGFTELLAGIDSWSAESGQDEIVQEEPVVTPPEWLAAAAEDESTGESQPQEGYLSPESAKALLEDSGFSWDDASEQDVSIGDASMQPEGSGEGIETAQEETLSWDADQEQPEPPAEPAAVPDWLTEPEYDFFAQPSEQSAEPALSPEDALQAELAADMPDWLDEQEPEAESFTEYSEVEQETPGLSEDQDEAGWLSEQPTFDARLSEASIPTEEAHETGPLVMDEWAESDRAPSIEADEPAGEVALDWLQPQAAEIDWLDAYAKPEAEALETDLFRAEEALSFPVEEGPAAQVMEMEPPSVESQAGQWEGSDVEAALPGDETDRLMASREDQDQTSGAAAMSATDEGPAAADDSPAWMADLEPVGSDDVSPAAASDLLDTPYDPFEGGSADNVPEYRSAKETGILQPNESPDWMAAFGDEEAPVELAEAPEVEVELEDQESFLAALGIEAEEAGDWAQEPEARAIADSLADIAAQAEEEPVDLTGTGDEPVPSAEEAGGMPDWLAAITTSASGQFDELFDDEESYSPSAEASGVVSERELDWLQPLGEADEAIPAEEPPGQPLDLEAIFGDAAPDDEALQGADAVPEAEVFDFDLDEAQVAPADDLAHTRDLEEEAPWLEDEESVPDDFSFDFDEIVPRWLREPKEGNRGASLRQNEIPPTPNWLRDVFDDEEFKE